MNELKANKFKEQQKQILARRKARGAFDFSKPVKTDQSAKNMSDINNIMEIYSKTGVLPQTKQKIAQYIDNTEIPSLMEAHEQIAHAKQLFMELPARLRKQMDNDPRQLETFITDPENTEVLTKYGLLEKKIKEKHDKVDPIPSDDPTSESASDKK